jgi:prepilin-type N-terminal cleavage/methylation domain-containing protein
MIDEKTMIKGRKNRRHEYLRREHGFTLTELVIVTVVSGILLMAAVPFFKLNVDSYVEIKAKKDMMQSARMAFSRMMAELHRIEDSLDISNGDVSQITFDVPDDGLGFITYELSGNEILRQGQKFLGPVNNFILKYYGDDGTEKWTPFQYHSDVWRVYVEVVVGEGSSNLSLRGLVSPRNFHYQ